MRFCIHCQGHCSNSPPMSPKGNSSSELHLDIEDVYKSGNWGINCGEPGYMLHKHQGDYFGVFGHFWSREQGWPHREPILICSYCEVQIPNKTLLHLNAARNLLRPKT